MSVEFSIRWEEAMKRLKINWSALESKARAGMKYGMDLFAGQIIKEQLSVVDGYVGPHGRGASKRTTDFGLRTVTGTLKRSVAVKEWPVGYDYVVRMGMGGMNAPYAVYHQFGTKRTKKRLYVPEEFKETGRELIGNAVVSRALGFKRVGSFF